MSKYVISTLTAPTKYVGWDKNNGVNTIAREVTVRGGAGIALPDGGRNPVTPAGVRTEISDEDAAFLAAHPHFLEHQKKGFVRIANRAEDPDKAAASMGTDASRPRTDKDVAADNKKNNKDDESTGVQAVTNKAK